MRHGIEQVSQDCILVVFQQELKPFTTDYPAGLIVIDGAPFSHDMIRLLGLGIPTVIVPRDQADILTDGLEIELDGGNGLLIEAKDESVSKVYARPKPPDAGVPIKSIGGATLELCASVADRSGASNAVSNGAYSIGLVRSEFLVPSDTSLLTVDYFENSLGELCEAAFPLEVTIRLLDFAPSKQPASLKLVPGMLDSLGMQGVRLYNREPLRSVIHAQVEAIELLSRRYKLRVLIPFITNIDEFKFWRDEIELRLNKFVPIGAMVETPVAALEMPRWFDVADFVAIGCNDLMQYLFAADRDSPELRDFLDPYAPAMFRFMRQLLDAAGEHINKVQLCGLYPQLPGVLPVLAGMGYRAFSVEPFFIPYLAQTIRQTQLRVAEHLSDEICLLKDSQSVRKRLELIS